MQALILMGQRRDSVKGPSVECLYAGLDGVALEKAAKAAAESKAFSRIEKFVNPHGTPMAIDPTPMVSTERPKPIVRKPTAPPKTAKGPKHIDDFESDLARQRKNRFNIPQTPTNLPAGQAKLRADGPTVNEFVAGGQPRESYPPIGFAAKPEPFDQEKVDELIAKEAKAKADADAAKKAPETAGGSPAAPKAQSAPPARTSGPPARSTPPGEAPKVVDPAGITETQAAPAAPAAETQTNNEGKTNE